MKKASKDQDKGRIFPVLLRGTIGVAGFILSPLSWWNDLFVNFPLAYGFAWGIGGLLSVFMVIHRWLFVNLFVAGYFLTNLIGFLMIHYSIFGLKAAKRGSIKKQVLVSVCYTLVIVAFFGMGICSPEGGCSVFPSWVEP
jgi:hypothetical protein